MARESLKERGIVQTFKEERERDQNLPPNYQLTTHRRSPPGQPRARGALHIEAGSTRQFNGSYITNEKLTADIAGYYFECRCHKLSYSGLYIDQIGRAHV